MKFKTNKVYCGDCIGLCDRAPEGIVNLTVTSPPYNVGIPYGEHGDAMPYDVYMDWLDNVWKSIYKLQADHSFIAVNMGRNTEFNTPAHIAVGLEKAGFKFYKSVQWVKPVGAATQVFWFKYPYPRYYEPYLITEDILIYSKGEVKGEFRGEKIDCLDDEFVRSVATNVWNINPDSGKVSAGIHPAPYPLELPARLIRLLSLPGDLVFDPFVGSGTTLQAAAQLGRNYLGTDIDKDYCKYARNLLKTTPVVEVESVVRPFKVSKTPENKKKQLEIVYDNSTSEA
jgi:DNA modification methylase